MTKSNTLIIMGAKIREARLKADLSQEELAKATGISTNYYARIERGETNISVEKLEKITKILKIKSSKILPF